MDDIITLLKEAYLQNQYGVWEKTPTDRVVYARRTSVSKSEFFDGARIGLKPDCKFTVFASDYEDETELMHRGKPYRIYRTYIDGDYIELYAERLSER